MPTIRPLALCIFLWDEAIFVCKGTDSVKTETFYRLLGGGIDFGETGEEAVRRELREELGQELANLTYLVTLENIYVYQGNPGHEIVRVYQGDFVAQEMYQDKVFEVNEPGGISFSAMWKPLDLFRSGEAPLYPDGLLALLASS